MSGRRLKAVALKYPEGAEAPFVAAAAKGALAEELLKIAEEHSVPVVQDDFLADVLTVQGIGSYIPYEVWELVAKIFACVVETDKSL
ncbi:MAG: EscU/YscU/HrcU family type III secretion system export apparatus switch protein [Treponemataceae bacterium]|nr:EscU/YscU/HrcU family type III secretion system export apparatus switch protein [Treponemataceae bacterium]